jgi:hypothetical protein
MALNMALKNYMDWIDGNNFNVWNNRGVSWSIRPLVYY